MKIGVNCRAIEQLNKIFLTNYELLYLKIIFIKNCRDKLCVHSNLSFGKNVNTMEHLYKR